MIGGCPWRNRRRGRMTTHSILGLPVGAGIQQQPHTICAAILSGAYQRRVSALRVDWPPPHPPPETDHTGTRRNHPKYQNREKQRRCRRRTHGMNHVERRGKTCAHPSITDRAHIIHMGKYRKRDREKTCEIVIKNERKREID